MTMQINRFFAALFSRYLTLCVDDAEGGAAPAPAADYGHEFTPDGEDAPAAAAPEGTAHAEVAAPTEATSTEPTTAAPEAEDKPSPMIPKARLDEVLAKNKELQAQLAVRQEQQTHAQAGEILQALEAKQEELQDKYDQAVMDGDSATAKQLRTELRSVQQQYNSAFAQQTQQATIQQLQMQQNYQSTLAQVETEFPVLNEDSEQFDPEVAKEVVDLMKAYQVAHGLPPHEALAKAARMVAGSATQAAPAATAKTPEQLAQEAAAAKIAAAEAKAGDRKGAAVAKNVAAANATPPDTSAMGRDGDAAGLFNGARVTEMSESEFAALRKNERALSVARGDLL